MKSDAIFCNDTDTELCSKCTKHSLLKKRTIHHVTNMLATSKNVLFPGHNHCYWRSGNNQSVGLSAPVVSRWLWPGNRTFLEVASMVVTWCIVAFLHSDWSNMPAWIMKFKWFSVFQIMQVWNFYSQRQMDFVVAFSPLSKEVKWSNSVLTAGWHLFSSSVDNWTKTSHLLHIN